MRDQWPPFHCRKRSLFDCPTCSILTGFALFAFIYFGFAELPGESSLAATFHAAYSRLPDPVLPVAVFFAVHANQVHTRGNWDYD